MKIFVAGKNSKSTSIATAIKAAGSKYNNSYNAYFHVNSDTK